MARVAILALMLGLAAPSEAAREAVLKQVDLPHSYYWRELYIPQLTTGPSSASVPPVPAPPGSIRLTVGFNPFPLLMEKGGIRAIPPLIRTPAPT